MKKSPLRLATVFSGISAIEQALLRTHVNHEIVFACDNGDQTPYPCAATTTEECIAEFKRLEPDIRKMRPTSDGLGNAYEIIKQQRDRVTNLIAGAEPTSTRPNKELKDRVAMLHETVCFYKFRVDWEHEPNFQSRKAQSRKAKKVELYQPLLNRNAVRKSYQANYPTVTDDKFHWNVSFLEGGQYRDQVDLFVGGSPCQSFSMVGKQMGLSDTRGTLFYEYARLRTAA